ncbi:hypothetical protein, partial [Novosphingobium fuchskuhlense]|uniref:hypothetical protein n=1 Tax=Novosphingobium fuchskuhlense TaxID=1117702 RepID=UPI001969AEE7
GGAAYMEGVVARQRDFAFFLKQVANPPETRGFADSAPASQIAAGQNHRPESNEIISDSLS